MSAIPRDLRAPPPPGLFESFVANKGTSANRPSGDPCVTLGPRLGDPRVPQESPKPNPNQAEGRKLKMMRGAKTGRATNCHRERAGFDRESNDLGPGEACTSFRLEASS